MSVADIDLAVIRADYHQGQEWDHYDRADMRDDVLRLCDEVDRLREAYVPDGWETDLNARLEAKLAEVEAERDKALARCGELRPIAAKCVRARCHDDAVSRLAEVEALAQMVADANGMLTGHAVLAAAKGEGDRPAEYVRRCDCATPGNCDGCHCWRGEGDR